MAGAGDERGEIVRRSRRHQTPLDLQEGLSLLHEMVDEVAAGQPILGIGAAIGGPLDWRTGVVSPLHQPNWRQVPLKEEMEGRWGCPFFVDVDTNVAALAEYHWSPDRPGRFLYVTVSTGMGGGFLVDGRIYRGANGEHPEVGHQAIPYVCSNPSAVQCECGVVNCLEALVSGNGIRRIYGRAAEDLDEAQWQEVTYNLAHGLRNLMAITLPDVVVLGGGVAVGRGPRLVTELRQILARFVRIVPLAEIRLSGLGYDTALRGALVIAKQGLNGR
jgi:predicted NBD/HSP70 family sugar kinase